MLKLPPRPVGVPVHPRQETDGEILAELAKVPDAHRKEEPLPGVGVGKTVPDPRRRQHFAQINGVQYQYPTCAVCGRDVVAFCWSDHFEHDQTRKMRTFFVACHGEIESVTFAMDELYDIKTNEFKFAEAFVPKVLEREGEALDALPEYRGIPRLVP